MVMLALMALATALVTFGFSFAIRRLSLKYKLYPKIRERDVHTTPTPRLGGVAMFLGILVAFIVASQIDFFHVIFAQPGPVLAIMGAAFLIVLVGVLDDLWDLDWTIKLAAQLGIAALVAWQGVQILSLPIGGITVGSPTMSFLLTIFVIVLVMNAVNFIDGLDGLVAGVSLISNGVFLIYSYLLARETSPSNYFNLASLIAAVLVGACAGFLPFNWHKARLFMGDAGSMLVGLLMAVAAIAVTGQIDPSAFTETGLGKSQLLPAFLPIMLPFAILLLPLVDFSLAVLRRVSAGKSPFTADRKHLHHRLLDMGHSHLQAVLILYTWTAVVSIGFLLFFIVKPYAIAIVFLIVGTIISTVLTVFPLTRRQKAEVAIQSLKDDAVLAEYDPLDAASNKFGDDIPVPAEDVIAGATGQINLGEGIVKRGKSASPKFADENENKG
ncbi:undecaprenyl-phosphate alpha-N-acetylglucosaminyl 1-phosphate transferase [Aurantimicrobium sp. INA4]|uniref:MraY family glycosyltransferase n=1 Tax=Aurantimicrobium sp. INA4 TaxID=2986279 RepID=UPI00248F9193|nr:MraY family glycosyltransferase [Aurantimicrobium sp. INA4]BDU11222.1 undecaprenyl-phosphate alpha-N-acetylglucosaminyl 1-phosphate transferase [Aurantimicrobium sp. INA4]